MNRSVIESAIKMFEGDPPDTDYQRGYLACLEEMLKSFDAETPEPVPTDASLLTPDEGRAQLLKVMPPDFHDYIRTDLAGDYACAQAAHIASLKKQILSERVAHSDALKKVVITALEANRQMRNTVRCIKADTANMIDVAVAGKDEVIATLKAELEGKGDKK